LNDRIYLKPNFDAYIRNWLDDYLKTKFIINEFSNIEKEESNFIKYIKYLKVNCLIMNNFIESIDFFIKNNFYYKNIKYTLIKWGLGIGPNPQSPIPNPQSPIPIKKF